MPTAYLTGNDGAVVLGTDFAHNAHFNVWNATFSRVTSDISGFSDAARRRRLGVHDVQGSAGGFLKAGAADTRPGLRTNEWASDGVDILLHARAPTSALTATAGTACTMSFKAILTDAAISHSKVGDAAITFNFQLAGGAAPTETWDET
jgi:hypothetical protein